MTTSQELAKLERAVRAQQNEVKLAHLRHAPTRELASMYAKLADLEDAVSSARQARTFSLASGSR